MMASILVRPEDPLEGNSNFNTQKAKVLNILKDHDLNGYVSNVAKEPNTNHGCTSFKKNQSKAKRIIYDSMEDNLMHVIMLEFYTLIMVMLDLQTICIITQ